MTIGEMRKKLWEYCSHQSTCKECKLYHLECGRNKNFMTTHVDGRYEMTDEEIFDAYAIVFPSEENAPTEEAPKKQDVVEHPAHYCYSKYEPKDVIRAWGLNFNLGSAVKYIARAGRKDDILQDLKKARQFLTFEIEALEEAREA